MAEFKYEITEFIGALKESDSHDWVKAITRISWNYGPSNLDIRNINMAQNILGKGISITDEEAETLTNILLDEGFGSVEKLQEALNKKKCFSLTDNEANEENNSEEDIIRVGV